MNLTTNKKVSPLKRFFTSALPGWVTTSGAGAVIINAAMGATSGSIKPSEAIFQASLGVIAIGLRRAISRLNLP